MQKMIRIGYTPTTMRTLQRYCDQVDQGIVLTDDEWKGVGCKRIMTDAAIVDCVETWRLSEEHGNKNINQHMKDYQAKLIKKSGGVPIALKDKFARSTINNYTCQFASVAGVSLMQKSIGKSRTRFISKYSIRTSLSDLALIGSTHFVPVTEEDLDI